MKVSNEEEEKLDVLSLWLFTSYPIPFLCTFKIWVEVRFTTALGPLLFSFPS